MTRVIETDFNDVQQDGRLIVSMRRIGVVAVGDLLVVSDPGDDGKYEAVVERVEPHARKVTLRVDWKRRPGFVRLTSPHSFLWTSLPTTSRGAEPIVADSPVLVA